MWDKNYRIKCDTCGKYCIPYDQETPFGCANPEYPEPYDPDHYCKKCSKKLYEYWLKTLSKNLDYGCSEKSNAEIKVAKELGLEWIDSSSYIDKRTNLDVMHRYIKKKEKRYYVPYLDFLKSPENRKKHEMAMEKNIDKINSIPF